MGGTGQGRGIGVDTGVEVGSPVATEWSKAQSQRVGNTRLRPDPPGQRRAGQAHPATPCPEGVLTLRARPPSEAEFVDCFRKTKLAINLLVSRAAHPILRADVVGGVPCPWCHPTGRPAPCPQAKLQKHIQNPSAAELVHFLFGPLDLVPGAGGRQGLGRGSGGLGGLPLTWGEASAHLGQWAGAGVCTRSGGRSGQASGVAGRRRVGGGL